MVTIQEGDEFPSYEDFIDTWNRYQKENFVLFVKGSCKKLTVDTAHAAALKYQFVKFVCKQGKKVKKSQSTGIRPNQRTLKCNCQALLRLMLCKSDEGQLVLKVSKALLEHNNHPTNEKTVSVYPENRPPIVRRKSRAKSKVEDASMTHNLTSSGGNWILPNDVSSSGNEKGDVESLLEDIKREGGGYSLGHSEDGHFSFLAFATKQMIADVKEYPELLILYTTYKTNAYLYPLLNVMCLDGNGCGHLVMHALVRNESCEIISFCLNFMKDVYDSEKTSLFYVDKDLSKIGAVNDAFPLATVKLRNFCSYTAVKKALRRLGLQLETLDKVLGWFWEQHDTRSEGRYWALESLMLRECADSVTEYFMSNWWNCPELWAAHKNLDLHTLHATTANHVESYHNRVKLFLTNNLSLKKCIQELLCFDNNSFRAKEAQQHLSAISLHYNITSDSEDISKIRSTLTPLAGELVIDQLKISEELTCSFQQVAENKYVSMSDSSNSYCFKVTPTLCSCDFFSKFQLPCRHIFSLRSFLSLVVYNCPSNSRFLRCVEYSKKAPSFTPRITHLSHLANTSEGRFRTRTVSNLTDELNSCFLQMRADHFSQCMSQFREFVDLVKSDFSFSIVTEPCGSSIPAAVPTSLPVNIPAVSTSTVPLLSSHFSNIPANTLAHHALSSVSSPIRSALSTSFTVPGGRVSALQFDHPSLTRKMDPHPCLLPNVPPHQMCPAPEYENIPVSATYFSHPQVDFSDLVLNNSMDNCGSGSPSLKSNLIRKRKYPIDDASS